MGPFATYTDVQDRWRPLTQSEQDLATVLIADASDMIRVRWSDMDARLEAATITELTLVRVVAGMVRRAMMNRNQEGITQLQQTTGPFSDGATFSNPNNNLYLSADDIRALDSGSSPRAVVGWLI